MHPRGSAHGHFPQLTHGDLRCKKDEIHSMWLRKWLAHPLTRDMDLEDPRTTRLRRRIILEKPFLREIYRDWYTSIKRALPVGPEPVLELGSGAGFLSDFVPDLITSDVLHCDEICAVLDGQCLPFPAARLRAVVMTDVLHHLPNARQFFYESARCVRPGGGIIMIEPWVTPWSRLIHTRLHHEPFRPDAAQWEFPSSGALSGANGALPWIIFERDRTRFEQEFPYWHIDSIELMMPLLYLVSGGVSMRNLMPGCLYRPWQGVEKALSPWINKLAMFALIRLERTF